MKRTVDQGSEGNSIQKTVLSTLEQGTNKINRRMDDIYTFIRTTQDRIPKELGNPWQGNNGYTTIFLEDVVGRRFELPSILCHDMKVPRSTLWCSWKYLRAADGIAVFSRHDGDHISGPSRPQTNWQRRVRAKRLCHSSNHCPWSSNQRVLRCRYLGLLSDCGCTRCMEHLLLARRPPIHEYTD